MLDRRTFLASTSALGALALAGLDDLLAQVPQSTPANERDSALDRMLIGWFQEDLRENPIQATNLGIDVGELAARPQDVVAVEVTLAPWQDARRA